MPTSLTRSPQNKRRQTGNNIKHTPMRMRVLVDTIHRHSVEMQGQLGLIVEEVDRLLPTPQVDSSSGVRDLALLAFLYNTGLRVGELCALNRADVQLPADGWGQVQLVGKGRRLRWVPMNAHARRTLEDYLAQREDDNPALFLNRSGQRFSVRGVALLANRYLRRIGITDRSGPHLLRHTFATHALRARPNLRAVQELLGHSSVTTTQRYTHMDADDLRRQVELLGNGCPR